MKAKGSCAHPACHCSVGDGERFCGSACAAAGSRPSAAERDLACGCGHPECYRDADSALGEPAE